MIQYHTSMTQLLPKAPPMSVWDFEGHLDINHNNSGIITNGRLVTHSWTDGTEGTMVLGTEGPSEDCCQRELEGKMVHCWSPREACYSGFPVMYSAVLIGRAWALWSLRMAAVHFRKLWSSFWVLLPGSCGDFYSAGADFLDSITGAFPVQIVDTDLEDTLCQCLSF